MESLADVLRATDTLQTAVTIIGGWVVILSRIMFEFKGTLSKLEGRFEVYEKMGFQQPSKELPPALKGGPPHNPKNVPTGQYLLRFAAGMIGALNFLYFWSLAQVVIWQNLPRFPYLLATLVFFVGGCFFGFLYGLFPKIVTANRWLKLAASLFIGWLPVTLLYINIFR